VSASCRHVHGLGAGCSVVAFAVQDESSESVVVALEARKNPPPTIGDDVRRLLNEQFGIAPKDVVVLQPGQLPKTSSGKLQRAKTRELYETGELYMRTSARDLDRLDTVKELARSQLGYFRTALFGSKNED
jgi:acyl-CoA synthetase (AMP-forming)/AMP-acid ligase II